MKYLKLIINYGLSFNVMFTPIYTFANDPISAAETMAVHSHKVAKAHAKKYVKEDFYIMTTQFIEQMKNYAQSKELYTVYQDYIGQIEKDLLEISKIEFNKEVATRKLLESYIQKYEKTIRDRFKASWIPSEQRRQYDDVKYMLNVYANEFKKTCQRGRSDADVTYADKGINEPGYLSSFKGKLNFDLISGVLNFSPVNWQYSYHSVAPDSETANMNRMYLVNTSVTLSNIANSMWIGSKVAPVVKSIFVKSSASAGTVSTAGLGGINSAMVTAAPYLMAASAVIILSVELIAKEEAYKYAKEVIKANNIIAKKTADKFDVKKYYIEVCENYISIVNDFLAVFNDIDNPVKMNQRVSEAKKLNDEIVNWETESRTIGAHQCIDDLNELYKNHGCTKLNYGTDISSLKKSHVMDPDNPQSMCFIDQDETIIFAGNGSCKISYDQHERSSEVEFSQSEIEKYNKKYPISKVKELLIAKLSILFSEQGELEKSIKMISLSHIDKQQQEIFSNITKYINLLNRIKEDSEDIKKLNTELSIYKQLYSFRDTVFDLTANYINVVFSKYEKDKLFNEVKKLKSDYEEFNIKYRHIEEVKGLYNTINYLYNEVESL